MNPWHFRQVPFLLFLTPPPPGNALQEFRPPACQGPMTGVRPPGRAARAGLGSGDSWGAKARLRSSWTPLATPSSPARPPAARWQRGRLITSRVRKESVSSAGFLFLSFPFSNH